MLLLTRKHQESVIITTSDGVIKITALHGKSPNQIRLGFDAPKEISIHREEVQKKIEKKDV